MTESTESTGTTGTTGATEAPTLPNLIIAGVRKGGTTSLSQYLSQHPDICSSELKKVGYFLPAKYGEPLASTASYAAHFEGCANEPYRMEATPGYFLGGRAVADQLAATLPDSRVIISLREPVSALWSNYRFVRSHARIDASLTFDDYVEQSKAMMDTGADLDRTNNAFVAYRGGFYDTPLTEWADALGSRLRIVFFDDLMADTGAVLRDILRWLDLDISPVDQFDLDVHNKSVQVKNLRVQKSALAVNRSAKKFFRRHNNVKRLVRSAYYRVNGDRGEQPRLGPALRAKLEAEYSNSNDAVAKLLAERELSGPLPPWLEGRL